MMKYEIILFIVYNKYLEEPVAKVRDNMFQNSDGSSSFTWKDLRCHGE